MWWVIYPDDFDHPEMVLIIHDWELECTMGEFDTRWSCQTRYISIKLDS